ncbi:MAG: 50S ribosomal protein L25 [Tissierellia bacterium]|nr:50S ribosomal protein L25 [Tissierellia bacterium]
MSKMTFSVEKREGLGKNKVNKLRDEKLIPGILYTKGEENVPILAAQRELEKIVNEAGTSNLVELSLDGEQKMVLFKEVQMHPFKNQILHFDLYGVNMKEKLRLSIPVILHNRDDIQAQPSVLLQHLDEVEVECLPGNLPSAGEVEVQDMEIGDVLTVADLDVSSIENITVLTPLDEPVCSLSEPREEEIPEDEEELDIDAADVPTVDETEGEEVPDAEEE